MNILFTDNKKHIVEQYYEIKQNLNTNYFHEQFYFLIILFSYSLIIKANNESMYKVEITANYNIHYILIYLLIKLFM